jgi:predicted  nucleic acid-binding Zn-ribbon protein
MTDGAAILRLHDVHLLEAELTDAQGKVRLRKLGLPMERHPALERLRLQCLEAIDRRWIYLYERAYRRYGRGVAVVRDRVCQGCHITLPTALSPSGSGSLTLCESCGRILYWG